jgi:hypothetical protein
MRRGKRTKDEKTPAYKALNQLRVLKGPRSSPGCISTQQRWHMDKEHVKGATDNAVGKTKEVAGHVTGNKKLETEGKLTR